MSLLTVGTFSHPVELVSAAADLLKGAQFFGAERIPSLLAEFGVFTPQLLLERQLRASEEALGAEQTAHANTAADLARAQQGLDAQQKRITALMHELQLLKGDLEPEAADAVAA